MEGRGPFPALVQCDECVGDRRPLTPGPELPDVAGGLSVELVLALPPAGRGLLESVGDSGGVHTAAQTCSEVAGGPGTWLGRVLSTPGVSPASARQPEHEGSRILRARAGGGAQVIVSKFASTQGCTQLDCLG